MFTSPITWHHRSEPPLTTLFKRILLLYFDGSVSPGTYHTSFGYRNVKNTNVTEHVFAWADYPELLHMISDYDEVKSKKEK